MKIDNVTIVGATHGNEPVGIHLINRWEKNPGPIARDSFNTHLLMANKAAAKRRQRYIDKDLNRCFHPSDLTDHSLSAYEDKRAKEINDAIGQKGRSPQDLIVDLHTTTANMGTTLICESTPGNLMIAGSLKLKYPHVKIYCFPPSDRIQACLRSITTYGIGIEIGPISQNLLRHDILELMEEVTLGILDVIHGINTGVLNGDTLQVDVYEHVRDIAYPKCSPENTSVIHRDLQDRDYCALKQGDNIFINYNQDSLFYEDTRELFPVFINEAAYYEKYIALSLAQKKRFSINNSGPGPVFNNY